MTNSSTTYTSRSNVPARSNSPAARGVIALIRGYQWARVGKVSPCRFTPSCSQYAREAVEEHGAVIGTAYALRRLAKCRPGGPHGIDLVPLKGKKTA
jgi:putative membrane protein insertion efficiency factor